MSAVYAETSALLAWLLGEPRAKEVAVAIDGAETVLSSVLTVTEARRGLLRAEQLGRLTPSDHLELRGRLERLVPQCMWMEVTEEVRAGATAPFPDGPVRTLDALHLSTALAFRRAFPDLSVLSFDERISRNATALGLA